MTTFDKYAGIFLIAFASISVVHGINSYYREIKVTEKIEELTLKNFDLTEKKDCWKHKAQEHTVGIKGRQCK